MDLPPDFWQSIRHVSSFRNIADYNAYLEIKIREWQESGAEKQALKD